MNKKQIKVFEELLASEDFVGKKDLKHLLWRNTSKPKYAVGDCFKVTDYNRYIFGQTVVDFNAKIVKPYTLRLDEEWKYELEMICRCGEREEVIKMYMNESELHFKAPDNMNTLLDNGSRGNMIRR